jgi:crotonobetainyl-CoA:carnitine CoA-transferase CaiB-like acyl-CoA transferase
MAGPLAGVRIIDITSVIAGPFATMILGDLGATVIKIEAPRGDDSRHLGPPFMHGTAVPFLGLNRNKYSLCLNLKHPAAIDIVYRLAEGADVFLESNRPGTMERLGLGYEALRQRNPRLIYCANSPYGTAGPHREQAGYELAIQHYVSTGGTVCRRSQRSAGKGTHQRRCSNLSPVPNARPLDHCGGVE